MRYLLAALVAAWALLACAPASAVQFEIGAGMAHAFLQNNGTWWQEGFPHHFVLTQPFLEGGITGRLTARMDWHLDAVSLGRYAVNSWDTPRDANYNADSPTHCNGPCLPLANYIGNGRIYGVQALLARHTSGAWRWGVEGGPMLYHETWRLNVPNWYPPGGPITPVATYGSQWAVGAVFGVTLQHGSWTLAARYYRDDSPFPGHVGNWPPLWTSQGVLVLERMLP